jgi:hypothetical protein
MDSNTKHFMLVNIFNKESNISDIILNFIDGEYLKDLIFSTKFNDFFENYIIKKDDMGMLYYLITQYHIFIRLPIISILVKYNRLDGLKMLIDNGCDYIYNNYDNNDIIDIIPAIKNDYFDIIQYCNIHFPIKFTNEHANIAAEYKRFNIVRFLKNNFNIICTNTGVISVIKNGDSDILYYFIYECDINCNIYISDDNSLDIAAINGYTEVLQILYHNYNIFCSYETIYKIIQNGHLDTIKYLNIIKYHESNQFKNDVITIACKYNKIDILQYMINYIKHINYHSLKNKQIHLNYSNCILIVLSTNNLNIFKYLDSIIDKTTIKLFISEFIDTLCKTKIDNIDLLVYINLKYNIQCTYNGANNALESNNINIINYLMINSILCTSKGLDMAINNNHYEIVDYININSGILPTYNSANYAACNWNIEKLILLKNRYDILPNSECIESILDQPSVNVIHTCNSSNNCQCDTVLTELIQFCERERII